VAAVVVLVEGASDAAVEEVLAELGELERFRAFQGPPQWRGRAIAAVTTGER
jgi:hypothetical protein